MKKLLILLLTIGLAACSSGKKVTVQQNGPQEKYAAEIRVEDLKEHVYLLASDILEGRKTGEKGQKMAVNYLTAYYEHLELRSPEMYPGFLQPIPLDFLNKTAANSSENVLAYIEGTEFPDEVVVVSAHYDHLGKNKDDIYNGADDNASGTAAVMEIAQSFMMAKKKGLGPKRSVLFLHLTGEESGLFGSGYYIMHPAFPLKNTVADLNIDMVGRVDSKHQDKPEYIYLIGSDKLSKELHELSEEVNEQYTKLELDYTFNREKDPNRFYYRSDHYNFAKNNIPVIFYFNGEHEDYHKPTDTADKINFEMLALRARLVFYTAWEIANREDRLSRN